MTSFVRNIGFGWIQGSFKVSHKTFPTLTRAWILFQNLTSPREEPDIIQRINASKRLSPKQISQPLPPISLPPLKNDLYSQPVTKFIPKQLLNTTINPTPPPNPKPKKPKKLKCSICSKKISHGMEFICRCNKLVCMKHRLPETHDCSFDYKMFGKEILKKENPMVGGDKLNKFE